MNAVRVVLSELLGLFVDDWGFTALVLAWVFTATLILPAILPGGIWQGPVLFAGCAAILAFTVWRRAR